VIPLRHARPDSAPIEPPALGEGLTAVDEADLAVREALAAEYRFEGFLGQGGMSVVFLAREIALNRLVALKVLPRRLTSEGNAGERFRQEALIAASLDHPNIVPIHRIGSTPRCLWYAMKYIRGRSLEEMLRDTGPLGLHDCFNVVEQVAGALQYAHRRGVIHRDMKPANVMVDDNGWAFVCDFGVAKAAGNPRLTQTGGTLGTPLYMSPEQLYGQPLDGRSDQYSLAVLTFELLTGVHPFAADSVGEIVNKHCAEPAPRLADFRSDLPARVGEALATALSKKPEDRFGDVVEFLTAMGGRRPRRPLPSHTDPDSLATAVTKPLRKSVPQGRAVWRYRVALAGLTIAVAVLASRPLWHPAPEPLPVLPPVTATPIPAPVPAAGRLFISSEPWGQLYIDGARAGNTPALDIPVAPGPHTIRIVRDGWRTHEETISVAPGGEVRLTNITLERVRR
jgi:serine/threonine protein kinase